MREYKITFRAREITYYQTSVEAETPEEAMGKFSEDPGDYDWDEYEFGGAEEIALIECEGYWTQADEKGISNFISITPVSFNTTITL